MAKRNETAQAEAYLAKLPPDSRAGLNSLRKAIKAAAPAATLGISYGIPAFKIDGHPLVWFAGFKNHCSFFPGAAAIRLHADRLKRFKISKGTLQFPPGSPPSPTLVKALVKARMRERF